MSADDDRGSFWLRVRRLWRAAFLAGPFTSSPEVQPEPASPEPEAFAPYALLAETFTRLRQAGLNLGVAELLAAYEAVDGGWGAEDPGELAATAKLIWCSSRQEEAEFALHWERLLPAYLGRHARPPAAVGQPTESTERLADPPQEHPPALAPRAPVPRPVPEAPSLSFQALPLRVPYVPSSSVEDVTVQTHWPLPRRNMIYAWRYLRRPRPDGPTDVLDVRATVQRAAQQGYYLAPVYRRRERNHAHLIILADQGGSMTPLHRFTRDLIETVTNDSALEAVETYYFHNVPGDSCFADPYMTVRIPTPRVLAACDADTSVLIVSDAGAARGQRYLPRLQATAHFLAELRLHTTLIAWLNPLPPARWPGTTAGLIGAMVDMFPMDPDGLAGAIDVLRGQTE